MSNLCSEKLQEVTEFEKKLREILTELQLKTETLDKSREQLFEAENRNVQLQILVDNEKRRSKQMLQEVQSAVEVIRRLEDDKIRGQTERARLEINWNTAQTERAFLMDQARKLKLENLELKRRNENLEAKLQEGTLREKQIEGSVEDLKQQVSILQPVIKSNVEKLKEEQNQLFTSFQDLVKINGRIENVCRVVFMNTQRDKKEIQELKDQLMVMEMLQPTKSPPVIPHTEAVLTELSDKFQMNPEIEEKLTELCTKMSSTCLTQAEASNIPQTQCPNITHTHK